jgi:hypothetical protein
MSFLPRIEVRDKLQQESRKNKETGFRIKCGMTPQKRTVRGSTQE